MLATARPGGPSPFTGMSNTVKNDIREISNSGQFYVTPQICRELKHISSGVDHIKLDDDFQRTSATWGNSLDPNKTMMEKRGAMQSLDRAAGALFDVKNQMNSRKIQTQQDNQVREAHHYTMHTLKDVEMDMAPYAHNSVNRIKQFCDHIGVTDRYTGYRHNLNRGNRDPVRMGFTWLDPAAGRKSSYDIQPAIRRSAPAGTRAATVQFAPGPPASAQEQRRVIPAHNRSIQEQCGINTTFPGKTEYMTRYKKPAAFKGDRDFIVNPIPDFGSYGRPLATHAYEKSFSEYQTRYLFPDSSTPKLPWLRK